MTESSTLTGKRSPGRRSGTWAARLIYLLPILPFGVIPGYFLWGLDPDPDPSEMGDPVPVSSLHTLLWKKEST